MEIGSTTMRRSQTNRSAITNGNRQFAVGGDGRDIVREVNHCAPVTALELEVP
jgi:hypothetical protein